MCVCVCVCVCESFQGICQVHHPFKICRFMAFACCFVTIRLKNTFFNVYMNIKIHKPIGKILFPPELVVYLDLQRKSRRCLLSLKRKCFKAQDAIDTLFRLTLMQIYATHCDTKGGILEDSKIDNWGQRNVESGKWSPVFAHQGTVAKEVRTEREEKQDAEQIGW